MRLNVQNHSIPFLTHEGAKATRLKPELALRRSVMSCLLWEKEFYEDGQEVAGRIEELCGQVSPEVLAALAIEVRHEGNLRHVPLLLLCGLVKHGKGKLVSETIAKVISRADELTELLTIYWRAGKRPLSAQLKKGLALAFRKFDEYQLAKYNRPNAVKLRDVLFLSHAKPRDEAQAELWRKLKDQQLAVPDTWEVQLSSGADKCKTFTRLLTEGKLGYLALLRNLRGMSDAGVSKSLIETAIAARLNGAERVLPFRFIAAARAAPQFEPVLDHALCAGLQGLPQLLGRTVVLVDVSASMDAGLSAKSDLTRLDAACALAAIVNAEDLRVFSFSSRGNWAQQYISIVEVPPRRGMAGVDAIAQSQAHGGTLLFSSVEWINNNIPYDRLIVITDEQAFGTVVHGGQGDPVKALPAPRGLGYMINVASARNGVGYGPWKHVDGFSENVLKWIWESERALR